MEKEIPKNDLIEVSELVTLLEKRTPNLRLIDAPAFPLGDPRTGPVEYKNEHIPGALFFNIPNVVDKSTSFPNKIPTNEIFIENAKNMRVRKNDLIIIFDHIGHIGGPRVWYLFKLFGAENVKILNGGLPKWKADGHPVESGDTPIEISPLDPDTEDSYKYSRNPDMFVDLKYIHSIVPDLLSKKNEIYVLDARLPDKFNGTAPETRPGLRAGHIPGSMNLVYKVFANPDGMTTKNIEEVKKVFTDNGIDVNKKIIATCMQGTIACNILFNLWRIGKKDLILFDGAWCEYGSQPEPEWPKTA